MKTLILLLSIVGSLAADNLHYFNWSTTSKTIRFSRLPAGGGPSDYTHLGPYTVPAYSGIDVSTTLSSGMNVWCTIHYGGIVDAPPCGDTIPRDPDTPSSGATASGGCGTTWTVSAPSTAQLYWQSGTPPTNWRWDIELSNETYMTHTYNVLTSGVLWVQLSITAGATADLSLRDQSSRFPIQINNGGVYPPFSVAYADASATWQSEDAIVVPPLVPHTMLGNNLYPPTNDMSLSNIFVGQGGGTNLAQDGTLQKGFTVLYGLLGSAGQRQSEALEEIAQNLGGTNLYNASTNLSASAGQVAMAATNLSAAAAQFSTNIAGMSNLSYLSLLTNLEPNQAEGTDVNTNWGDYLSESMGNADYQGASNQLEGLRGTMNAITNFQTTFGHDSNFWTLYFLGHTVSVNPMEYPGVQSLANFIRFLITWTACAALIGKMFLWTKEYFFAQGAFHTGKSAVVSVSKTRGGWIGKVIGAIFSHWGLFVIVAFLFAGVTAIFVAWLSGEKEGVPDLLATYLTNPFNSADPWIQEGLWLVDQFVDIPTLLLFLAVGMGYNSFLALHSLAVSLALRALPTNVILFCVVQWSVNASDLQIINATTNQLFWTSPVTSSEFVLNSHGGGFSMQWDGPSVSILTNSAGSPVITWTNPNEGRDVNIALVVGRDSAGDYHLTEYWREGPMWALSQGLKVGGAVLGMTVTFWLVNMLRGRKTIERSYES